MKKGFTMIELLAVIAIVALLSIMLVPKVIELFDGATIDSIKIAENKVLDAANLYIEDYCRNPISDEYRSYCQEDKKTISANKVYFCLSTLQGRKVIKEVYYDETVSCKGLVVYDFNNYKYLNGKTYLYCGSDYTTEGGSTYQSYAGGC